MADTKLLAYAVNRIQLSKGNNIDASTRDKVSIFEVPDEETWDKLEGLGAIRKPTKDEMTLWKAEQDAANGKTSKKKVVEEEKDADDAGKASDTANTKDSSKPASGAAKDPQGKPSGKADDLGV